MEVKIACESKDYLPISRLTVLQDDLKSLDKEGYDRLKRQILETGFAFPIMVWKSGETNFIVGGTQRCRTLMAMEEDGITIPEIPVVYVEAKNKKDAYRRVLQDASQYGKIDHDGLYEFMANADVTVEELKGMADLPWLDTEDFASAYFKEDSDTLQEEEETNRMVECPSCKHKFRSP